MESRWILIFLLTLVIFSVVYTQRIDTPLSPSGAKECLVYAPDADKKCGYSGKGTGPDKGTAEGNAKLDCVKKRTVCFDKQKKERKVHKDQCDLKKGYYGSVCFFGSKITESGECSGSKVSCDDGIFSNGRLTFTCKTYPNSFLDITDYTCLDDI
jgi:hypothetical protein|tara:strand:+ start:2105 stop:2569 length:465 start_codon:yes stop_codon:yes gene_type:complete